MGVQEIKEDFLMSMGCSIANRYTYINDDGYDYFEKINEKDVEINNKLIPYRKSMVNTMILNSDLAISGKQAMKNVMVEIEKVQKSGFKNDNVAELANYTMMATKLYFADWIKYSTNKLNIDEKLLQYIISLVNSGTATLKDNIVNILNKYNVDLTNAKMEAMNTEAQLNAQTIAEAANAPKTLWSTTYSTETLSGLGVKSYTYGTTTSSISDKQLRGQFIANGRAGLIMQDVEEKSAAIKATNELNKAIENIISNFNAIIMETLVVKLKDVFNEDVLNNIPNLVKNPTNRNEWMKIIPELNDDELQELAKLNRFYGIGLQWELETKLANEMYLYYIEEFKTDFSSNDLKLYSLIKGTEIKTLPALSENITTYMIAEIFKKFDIKIIKNAKIANTIYDEEKNQIASCAYLTEADKQKLINKCDDIAGHYKEQHIRTSANFKKDFLIIGCSLVFLILSLVFMKTILTSMEFDGLLTFLPMGYVLLQIAAVIMFIRGLLSLKDDISSYKVARAKAGEVYKKSWWVTFILCLTTGLIGGHRFYVGKTISAWAQLLTVGGFGLWTFIDLCNILNGKFTDQCGDIIKRKKKK